MPNTYFSLQVHLVFSTRGRQPWIVDDWREAMWAYMGGICRNHRAVALAIGGIADHAHTLLGFKPTHRLCDLVREIKGGASESTNDICDDLLRAPYQGRATSKTIDCPGAAPRARGCAWLFSS